MDNVNLNDLPALEEIKSPSMDSEKDGNISPIESQEDIAFIKSSRKGDKRRFLIPSYLIDNDAIKKDMRAIKNESFNNGCCGLMKIGYQTFLGIVFTGLVLVGMVISTMIITSAIFGAACLLKYAPPRKG